MLVLPQTKAAVDKIRQIGKRMPELLLLAEG
jgi:hypothetical protein